MLKGPFLSKDFIGAHDDFETSKIVLIGFPFDGTASNRPGTRFAPQSVRQESIGIETYSPIFNKNMEDTKFFDAGDIDFPFGNPKKVLQMVEENVFEIYKSNKKVLGIGGEHLVTLGEIKAIKEFYKNLAVIQFDAHTDLRDEYLGETLTHAGVMKQIAKIVGFDNILQIGIRSGEKEEFELMQKNNTHIKNSIELSRFKDKNVFITLDVDVLDPSIMPGTGTVEAGGFSYNELISWLVECKKLNVIGADIVELSPDIDHTKSSTALCCKLIREMLMVLD